MIFGPMSLSPTGLAIGSAVLQFLWQGALIGLLTAALLAGMGASSPARRYAVAFGALLLSLFSFCASFALALSEPAVGAGVSSLQPPFALGESTLELTAIPASTRIAAWSWTAGVLVMALRFALQTRAAHRLKTSAVSEVDASWQRAFQVMAEDLGVARGVRILRSGLAEVPMVVGWLSPVVLVPAAAFTGLGPDQLRALLAHELSHIRRHDHLFNAAQAVIETVLFFHPVIWWISKQVRLEREFCCDDSSVRLTGDPKLLAESLAAMATLRLHRPMTHTALAANGGPLMQRITRILGVRQSNRTPLASWQLPAGLVLAGVLAFTGSTQAAPVGTGDGQVTSQDVKSAQSKVTQQRKDAELTDAKLEKVKRERAKRAEMERAEAAQMRADLEAAIQAGSITEEQAAARIAEWEKRNAVRAEREQKAKKVWAELESMVKAGSITEAQAKERFAGWAKQQDQASDMRAEAAKVRAELDAAVKSGRITQAQADQKFAEYRKSLSKKRVARSQEDPEAVIRKIQAAVEAGEMTPAQGKQKIEAYRKALADRKAKQAEALERAMREIEAAVASGKLTPEEGQAKLEAIQRDLEARARKGTNRR